MFIKEKHAGILVIPRKIIKREGKKLNHPTRRNAHKGVKGGDHLLILAFDCFDEIAVSCNHSTILICTAAINHLKSGGSFK